MKTSRLAYLLITAVATACITLPVSAQTDTTVRHVASRIPIVGASYELSAERPADVSGHPAIRTLSPKVNPWKLQATLPGAVIHDISFPTTLIGYAAAELGQVWKTTNGGSKWTEIMNLGFPYYWYGVKALSAKDVVVAGFNDSKFEGIIRWSHDGGKTWTHDVILTTNGWSFRVRFANHKDGLVLDGLNLKAANAAHYTSDGGAHASDWTEVVPDPNGGWFGNQFSLLTNLVPPESLTATAPTAECSGLVVHPSTRYSMAPRSSRTTVLAGWAEERFRRKWKAGFIARPTAGRPGAAALWMIPGRFVRFAF
jgi:hypothetical protein